MPATEPDKPFANVARLSVFLDNRRVGVLADTPEGLCAFEYDNEWLATGYSISPYSLPLQSGVFVPERRPFNGLFGVFNDSLPDGWGALLLDRMFKSHGVDPATVSPLTRLSIVGSHGRGGLSYVPETTVDTTQVTDDLDELARASEEIFDGQESADFDEVYAAGGSSAGARPKVYVTVDGREWLVKFPSSIDPPDIGRQEYAYMKAAEGCGLDTPETRLFPSRRCSGYFGTQRFDRAADGSGIHMVTASGMLEVFHRMPVLDYRHLFQVTRDITKDQGQLENLYRLMCFNVFTHNQDDHSNNFAWLHDEKGWRLAPAYDLTYSTSFGNEHATTANGKGNPAMDDLLALSDEAGLPHAWAERVAKDIRARCDVLLRELGLRVQIS